mmetsp:Transcript_27578/g.43033  ORF Transcript_27578/g.43033 Transcript_27578/m.43033 type:complete len:233 (-) Transcript_27578:57-755(-)
MWLSKLPAGRNTSLFGGGRTPAPKQAGGHTSVQNRSTTGGRRKQANPSKQRSPLKRCAVEAFSPMAKHSFEDCKESTQVPFSKTRRLSADSLRDVSQASTRLDSSLAHTFRRLIDAELDNECGTLLETGFSELGGDCDNAPKFGLKDLAQQVTNLAEVRSWSDEQLSAQLQTKIRLCRDLVQSLVGGPTSARNNSAQAARPLLEGSKNLVDLTAAKLAMEPFRSKSHPVRRR